jgi:hypothetical protein
VFLSRTTITDSFEQATTTQVFLETIPNNLRSYGCILIDGLVNDDDEIKSLVMQLSQISHKNSIFFFGLLPELAENPYVLNLQRNGLATLVPNTLPQLMSELSIEFLGDEGYSTFNETDGVTIFLEREKIKLNSPREKDLLLNIQGFARLLCYEDVEQKDRFPQEEKIHWLQAFLQ